MTNKELAAQCLIEAANILGDIDNSNTEVIEESIIKNIVKNIKEKKYLNRKKKVDDLSKKKDVKNSNPLTQEDINEAATIMNYILQVYRKIITNVINDKFNTYKDTLIEEINREFDDKEYAKLVIKEIKKVKLNNTSTSLHMSKQDGIITGEINVISGEHNALAMMNELIDYIVGYLRKIINENIKEHIDTKLKIDVKSSDFGNIYFYIHK